MVRHYSIEPVRVAGPSQWCSNGYYRRPAATGQLPERNDKVSESDREVVVESMPRIFFGDSGILPT
jgi:hypothetical protein